MKLLFLAFSFVAFLKLASGQTCNPLNQFQCDNGKCISGLWICDGIDDCGDMSDETCNSGNSPSCPSALHSCENGRCTLPEWLCNGKDECGDGSDEKDENGKCPECPTAAFKCHDGVSCIQPAYVCDGFQSCEDWSDEIDDTCPCAGNEWRCANPYDTAEPGPCIPIEYVCDEFGIWDCPRGDDEANCTVARTNI